MTVSHQHDVTVPIVRMKGRDNAETGATKSSKLLSSFQATSSNRNYRSEIEIEYELARKISRQDRIDRYAPRDKPTSRRPLLFPLLFRDIHACLSIKVKKRKRVRRLTDVSRRAIVRTPPGDLSRSAPKKRADASEDWRLLYRVVKRTNLAFYGDFIFRGVIIRSAVPVDRET